MLRAVWNSAQPCVSHIHIPWCQNMMFMQDGVKCLTEAAGSSGAASAVQRFDFGRRLKNNRLVITGRARLMPE